MRAATHLFASRGFRGTTIRDVARQAEISDAAIYYHFCDKYDLLHALMDCELEPATGSATSVEAAEKTLSQVLEMVAVRGLSLIERNAPLLRILLLEALAGNWEAADRYHGLLTDWESRLTHLLKPFERQGVLPVGESGAVASHLISILVVACEDALLLRPARGLSREERWSRLQGFLAAAFAQLAAQPSAVTTIERR